MPSDRRHFLQRVAVGAASLAAVPTALHAADASFRDELRRDTLSGPFSLDAVEREYLDAERSVSVADPEWDISWTKKLTGKHKALFDCPGVGGGAGVIRAGLWAKQYTDVLKAQPSDLSPVIVLRHEGIILAMQQSFWDMYKIGKRNNIRDGNGKKTNKNPALALPLAEGEKPRPFDAFMLEQQIARGVTVLACNMAFGGCVRTVMKEDKLAMPEARAKAIPMLVPGIVLQPSGIFADTLAQENGCVFVHAS